MEVIERHEYISKYLNNELSNDEKTVFEENVKSDPVLAKEVKMQRILIAGFQKADKEAYKKRFQKIDRTLPKTNYRFLEARKYIVTGLALAAILAGVMLLVIKPNQDFNEQLFAQNFEAPQYEISRGESDLTPGEYDQIQPAIKAYKIKDYKTALPIFEKAFHQKKNHELQYYMAVCQLAQNKTSDAITNLKELKDIVTFTYYNETRWYLALAYLKVGNVKDAKVLLNDLVNSDNSYSKKAKRVLSKLY